MSVCLSFCHFPTHSELVILELVMKIWHLPSATSDGWNSQPPTYPYVTVVTEANPCPDNVTPA